MKISECLSKVDTACDYSPVISTISNIVDLFQKIVIVPSLKEGYIQKSHYYTHLGQKSFIRCFVLLVPVLGNILIGLIDIYKFSGLKYYLEKRIIINNIKWNLQNLYDFKFRDVEKRFKEKFTNDREVVLLAVKQNGLLLQYAKKFQDDREVVEFAVKQYGFALKYVRKKLKDDKMIVLLAVQQDGLALQYASERLKDDREIVEFAVKRDGFALEYASERLKNDKKIVLAAVEEISKEKTYTTQEKFTILQYIGEKIKNDKETLKNIERILKNKI